MLNKPIESEENNNSKLFSNNYLDKEWVHTSGKNINDHSNHREDEKTNYLTDPTSILPSPTEIKTIFGNNKAESIISKKHRPVQKELLDKTNLHSKNNKITTQPTILIPSATNLDPTIINNSQKQNSFNTTQTYKKTLQPNKI